MIDIPQTLALNLVIIGILFIVGMYYLTMSLKKRLKKPNLGALLLPFFILLLITFFFGIIFLLLQGI